MAEIPSVRVDFDGELIQPRPAAADDTALCGPGVTLLVFSAAAADVDLTVTVEGTTSYGQQNPDPVIPCPAGEVTAIPMLDSYRDAIDSLAHLAWSDPTDIEVAVLVRR